MTQRLRISWIALILTLRLSTATDPANATESAAEGTLVVLNKSEASASLLRRADGEEVARLSTGVGPHEVAVSPDGRWAVVADYGAETGGNTLTVLDLRDHEVAGTIDLGEHTRPHGILYLPDGEHVLVTTEGSQHLLKVHVETNKIAASVATGGRIGHMVAMTPDARRAFVPHMGSDTVAAFDLDAVERLALIEVGAQPEGIDVSPDGAEVWVTNREADSISIIDAESLEVTDTIACGQFPIRLKFTPDGKHVLVSNARSGDVAVFDAAEREEVRRIPMELRAKDDADARLFGDQFDESPVPVGILIPPDGRVAWVASTNADVVSEIDLQSWTIVRRLRAGTEPDGLGYARSVAP